MKIFVSYSHKDARVVRGIAAKIDRAGHEAWIDHMAIPVGARWPEEIARGVRRCDAFLILISRHSIRSAQVVNELHLADRYRKRIIPLRHDRSPIPESMLLILSGIQYIDYSPSMSVDALLGIDTGKARRVRPRARPLAEARPEVIHTKTIAGSPEDLFRVAAAVESYPEWHSAVRTVKVLGSDKSGYAARVRWGVGLITGKAWFEYVVRYTYDSPRLIAWHTEPNDYISEMVGSYEFIPVNRVHTQAVCSLRLVPKLWIPTLLQKYLTTLITSTRLGDLQQRVERRKAG